MADVVLVFNNPTEEQLEHIHNAENELSKAGVTFDSSTGIGDNGKITDREWELESWSLKGARIVEAKPAVKV